MARHALSGAFHMLHVEIETSTSDLVAYLESSVRETGPCAVELLRIVAATGEVSVCGNPATFWNSSREIKRAVFVTLRWALHRLYDGNIKMWSVPDDVCECSWLINGFTFSSPFVVSCKNVSVVELRQRLLACSFKAGFIMEDDEGELVGRLDDIEILRLRGDGSMVLLLPLRTQRTGVLGKCKSEVTESSIKTFFCLRSAIRSIRKDYDLLLDTSDRTGATWCMHLMNAFAHLQPGDCLPPVGQLDTRQRRASSLRAALCHYIPCYVAGPLHGSHNMSASYMSYVMLVQQWQHMQMAMAIADRRHKLFGGVTPL